MSLVIHPFPHFTNNCLANFVLNFLCDICKQFYNASGYNAVFFFVGLRKHLCTQK